MRHFTFFHKKFWSWVWLICHCSSDQLHLGPRAAREHHTESLRVSWKSHNVAQLSLWKCEGCHSGAPDAMVHWSLYCWGGRRMPLVGTVMKKKLRRRATQKAWCGGLALRPGGRVGLWAAVMVGRLSWADGSFMDVSGFERLRCSWRTTGRSSSFTKVLRRG